MSGMEIEYEISALPTSEQPSYIPPVQAEAGSSSNRAPSKSALQLQIEREDEELLAFIHVILNSEIQSTLWAQ
jgi:hypothetical protein